MHSIKEWPVLSEVKVKQLSNIDTIYVFGRSGEEVIGVTKDDNVYAFGLNESSCLGLGANIYAAKKPTVIAELFQKRIKKIVSSFHYYVSYKHKLTFVLALTKFGEIYSWGANRYGNLGNSKETVVCSPKLITALNEINVVDVCCGSAHCLALTQSGEVYAWGFNEYGQCGTGDEETAIYTPTIVTLLNGIKVVSIYCGGDHSLALTESGELYGWGCNGNGQLGGERRESLRSPVLVNLSESISIHKVSAGDNHTMVLSTDGDVYLFSAKENMSIEGQNNDLKVLPIKLSLSFKVVDVLCVPQYEVSILMSEDMKCYVLNDYKHLTEVPETTLNDAFNSFMNLRVTLKPVAINQFNSTPNIIEKFRHSFDNRKYSDISFKIDGKYIFAQKLLLRSICKHFDYMFGVNSLRENNTNEIEITQYSYSVFYSFMKYLHTNTLDINIEEILELLDLANTYLEDELKKECIEFIKRKIDIENVCDFYCVALKSGLTDLEDYCANFASLDIKKVFKTRGFEEMNEISVRKLFIKYGNILMNLKVTLNPENINQYKSTPVMIEKFRNSFDNQKYSDISFKIDGKYIYAQKLLLRSICKHFDDMFGENSWRESNTNEIEITQYSYSVFYAFLKYLHTNTLDLNLDEVIDLLDLANSYLEDELKKDCIEFIKRGIDIENVCHYYCVALKYELIDLESYCTNFAANDIKKVFKTRGFEEMNELSLRKLFIKYGNIPEIFP